MTSVIRYTEIVNATGAVFTTAAALTIDGKDGGEKYFKRTFADIDCGPEAGKTRDNTDPTKGCLLVTIAGAKIKGIHGLQLLRPTAATNATFNQVVMATAAHFFQYGYKISDDGYSVSLFDMGDDDTTQIVANDFVTFKLIFGNY